VLAPTCGVHASRCLFRKLPVAPAPTVKVSNCSNRFFANHSSLTKSDVSLALSLLSPSTSLRLCPPLSPVSLQLFLPRPSCSPFFLVHMEDIAQTITGTMVVAVLLRRAPQTPPRTKSPAHAFRHHRSAWKITDELQIQASPNR
jgi:hypothetical protein